MIELENGKYTYKSLLKNKTIKEVFDKDFSLYIQGYLGYAVYLVDGKSGVFDLTTMKWKVKPTDKVFLFSNLYYSSSDKLIYNDERGIFQSKDIQYNRRVSDIYIQSNDNVFYDLKLNAYKPSH